MRVAAALLCLSSTDSFVCSDRAPLMPVYVHQSHDDDHYYGYDDDHSF